MPHWTADDGTSIYYEREGARDAPTLLLLPGLLGAIADQWHTFRPDLAPDFDLILADLRGHGRSGNAAGRLSLQSMVRDLEGLLDALEVDRYHLAGYSLGGYLGLMLAGRDPRLATLLLHGTKVYWTPEAIAATRSQLDPDAIRAKVPAFAAQLEQAHGPNWSALARQARDFVAGMAAPKSGALAEGDLSAIRCPVVVSVGDRDELVPVAEALRLVAALPDGGLAVLPHTRHPFPTVRPALLLPIIRSLVERARARG